MITNGLFPFQKQFDFHSQVTMICLLNESSKFLSGCVFNLLRKRFFVDFYLLTLYLVFVFLLSQICCHCEMYVASGATERFNSCVDSFMDLQIDQ